MLRQYIRKGFATLVLGEHNGKHLSKNTLKLLSAAGRLKDECHIMICGQETDEVAKSIKASSGGAVSLIIQAQVKHVLAENVTNIVKNLIAKHKYQNVIGLASSLGKDIIPRLAGYYASQPISDILEVVEPNLYVRPTYAGNALTKISTNQPINFLTFRASAFEEVKNSTADLPIQKVQESGNTLTHFVKDQKGDLNKPQLTTARIVVSGGRGVKSKENFALINDLANALGDAAVGASRAAVDAGYCTNEMQVGQTGKVVAPQLYIAVGISGAVQHLAGMKDSKVIVAINNRPDEPIFEIATYGLEGDLFTVLPELTAKIRKLKGT